MEVNQEVSGMIDDLVRESVGEQLRKAREQKGLSARDVADSLRIMAYQIDALEQQNFSVFKADVFIRSYLRNYAELLGLDAAAILAQYQQDHFVERITPIVNRPKPVHLPCKKRYLGIVAVLVVIVLLWLANRELPVSVEAATIPAVTEIDDEASLSPNGNAVPADNRGDPLVEDAAVEEAILEEAIDENPMQEAASSDEPALDVASIIADAVSSLPEHRLELNFSAECWVEIKDAEGKTLIADIKREGDNVVIEGAAPFKVVLGYAPAVALSYNGEAVEINSNTRTQAARLVVGRS